MFQCIALLKTTVIQYLAMEIIKLDYIIDIIDNKCGMYEKVV